MNLYQPQVPSGGGGGISGSGTTNTITKFTGSTAVGNSSVTDDGTIVTFSTPVTNPLGTGGERFGAGAMAATTGAANTAFGFDALNTVTIGMNNAAFGNNACKLGNTTANTAIGCNALSGGAGNYNVAIGFNSAVSNGVQSENVAIGVSTMQNVTYASGSVAIGEKALQNGNCLNCVAVGYEAAQQGAPYCTAVGTKALQNGTTHYSCAFGYGCMKNAVTGNNNCAFGNATMSGANGSGEGNAAFGAKSLRNVTNGNYNAILGYSACNNISSGSYNTGINFNAMFRLQSGSHNIGIGAYSLQTLTTGSNNTGIGHDCNVSVNSASYQTVLGAQAVAFGDNTVTLGRLTGTLDTTVTSWLLQTQANLRVGTDATNNTATVANLTGLTQSLVTGNNYTGRLTVFANNSTAAEGIQFDFGGGTATFSSFEFGFTAVAGATLGTITSTAIGTPINITVLGGTGDYVIDIPFSGVCNGSGTLIPRFAENTSATGTATVRGLSFMVTTLMAN